MPEELSRRGIKYLMKRHNITRPEMAAQVQRTPATVSVWLQHERVEDLQIMREAIDEILTARKGVAVK